MFRRDYTSYGDYLAHQAAKTSGQALLKEHQLQWDKTVESFRQSFAILKDVVPLDASGICLGARYGEEVAALRDLGYLDMHGIDLIPYPPLVIRGDMHHVECDDGSCDFVFCNALDHAYNLDAFLSEVNRIARPKAAVLFHVALNNIGSYESIIFDSAEEIIALMPGWTIAHQGKCGRKPYDVELLFRREPDGV
jgi:hypothetical protein